MNYRLRRIARYLILAARKDDYIKRLKNARPDLDAEEEVQKILDLKNSKKEKMALHWICKGTLILPEDEYKLNQAFNLINRFRLDFQRYDSPMDVIEEKDMKVRRHIQSQEFDPRKEGAFSKPYNAGAGVIVYQVEESREGQLAVRRAIDASWGTGANPWCLAARTKREAPVEVNEEERSYLPGEKRKRDLESMEHAWTLWSQTYNSYPKRIAFQNGKLLAFCAGSELDIRWWDRKDKSFGSIPAGGTTDDKKFIEEHIETPLRKLRLSSDKDTDPKILAELAKEKNRKIRVRVADNPSINLKTIELLSEDLDDEVREGISKRKDLPERIIRKLANDSCVDVKMALAEREDLPLDLIEEFSRSDDYLVRAYLSKNKATPGKIILELAQDEDYIVRAFSLKNNKLPEDVLSRFSSSRIWVERRSVAENPSTPAEVLEKLSLDSTSEVREAVACNANSNEETLIRLAGDRSFQVLDFLSKNPNAPPEALSKLSEDRRSLIRMNVASNENTSQETLDSLARDMDKDIRRHVAKNPSTSQETLKMMVDQRDADIKASIIENPNAPMDILISLSKDKNAVIRAMAEERLEEINRASSKKKAASKLRSLAEELSLD